MQMKRQKGCEGVWDMVRCLCLGRREGGTSCSPVIGEGGFVGCRQPSGVGKEISVEQGMEAWRKLWTSAESSLCGARPTAIPYFL